LPTPLVTVVIPTLAADEGWRECLEALGGQTLKEFEALVVDNSGTGRVARTGVAPGFARVLENPRNEGFGAAINRGWRESQAPYLAMLNDDARPHAGWLEAMVRALEDDPRAGMAAAQVRLWPAGTLDSAGLGIAADGTSKQRGHGREPASVAGGECLLASGAASLWRREVFAQTGGLDESFFLYCEDTDLGLRARWLGWRCRYVPEAVVDHHYSASAGRASPLKAWLVERNRLRTVVKNFPARWLARAPFASLVRYVWHVLALFGNRGTTAEFVRSGAPAWQLAWFVVKAHGSLLGSLPGLWLARRAIMRTRRVDAAEFRGTLERYRLTLKEVASL
jgi:GT2 family glycosyltransferase